jgi:hypothetical protein
VLIADSEEKLQGAVIERTVILRGKGMAVNEMKSKVMMACRIEDQVGNLHIMCNNTELEQTTSFEYLGTIIHQNSKIEEVLNCVQKTNNIYYQLNQTSSSSSWVLRPDSSQDRLNYASPPDPIRRYFFPVSNPQCLQILLTIVQPSYWWSSFFPCEPDYHW